MEDAAREMHIFQSTLPARGATGLLPLWRVVHPDFNPRSPHGERRQKMQSGCARQVISIHAPRTGSDALQHGHRVFAGLFQSTLPARGATVTPIVRSASNPGFQSTLPARGATGEQRRRSLRKRISIHAPRTGSDMMVSICVRRMPLFQSTLPARGATGQHRRPR